MEVVLRDDGFWIAFAAAAVVTVLSLPLARARIRLSFATVAIPAACLALAIDYHLEPRLVIGLLAVGGAGMVRERVDGCLVPAGLVAVGAAFVVSAPPGLPGWMRVVGFATVVLGVPCAWVLDRRAARLVPFLAVITAFGVYVCVPDTELPLVVLGAVLPAALLALDPGATASPSTGAFVALLVESVLVGGHGRPGAIIGGLGCLGVVLLVAPTAWRRHGLRDGAVLVVTQAALVLWTARVAGLRESAWLATLLCIPAFAVAGAVLFATSRLGARAARQ